IDASVSPARVMRSSPASATMRAMRLALVSCLAWCLAGCAAAARTHVVVVSIDGLKPESYLEPDRLGLAVPTFRRMGREGVVGTDTRTVLPSVTYPSHTTIATGVPPAAHGIVSNYAFDPLGRNMDGWWWYAEDIRAPTVWDAARAAGRTVALIDWPVTVGAKADVLVPEYWRAGTADDQKIIRALATPGFLDEVAARRPGFWDRYTPPNVTDEAGVDLAEHALETRRPDLLFLHIWQTDHRQHDSAPGSPPALAALQNADPQLARPHAPPPGGPASPPTPCSSSCPTTASPPPIDRSARACSCASAGSSRSTTGTRWSRGGRRSTWRGSPTSTCAIRTTPRRRARRGPRSR